jgi:Fe2+ transport system protein FeoA
VIPALKPARGQSALRPAAGRSLGNLCQRNGKKCVVRFNHQDQIVGVNMKWTSTRAQSEPVELRCELCPLSLVRAGVAVRIKHLCAAPELQNRLRELGLVEDQIIRLLTSQTNFICQVCNARLAISQQLAQLILVEPLRPALAGASAGETRDPR